MKEILPNIFAVEVPEGAKDFYIMPNSANPILWFNDKYGHDGNCEKYLSIGSYTFLFCSNDVTEEQAEMVVAKFNNPVKQYHGKFYDYSQKVRSPTVADKLVDTAIESFQSLLRSNNLTGNYAIIKKN